jgi:hypothetical protein
VTYTIRTPEGPAHAIVGLNPMRKHAKPKRVEDLMDDLALLSEEVIAARGAFVVPAVVDRVLRKGK